MYVEGELLAHNSPLADRYLSPFEFGSTLQWATSWITPILYCTYVYAMYLTVIYICMY